MKFTDVAALLLVAHASASPQQVRDVAERELLEVIARAYPANAPNGYTPQTVTCPSGSQPTVRSAASLSPQEQAWLPKRRNATLEPMRDLLDRVNIPGFDATSYINAHQNNASALPNIGIAVSGGGYRAMLTAAGVLEAFDSRTTNATAAGQLGGLLQAATYLSGLSGGSWLVGSLYANNFTSIDQILAQDREDTEKSSDLWELDQSIFEGPKGDIQATTSIGYYADLVKAVQAKNDAGFNTSITDYWGRALSYQLVNATDGGPDYTFSSIAQQDFFTSGSVPLPLIVADGRSPGQMIISGNSTIYTFNPWELGSDDPTLFGFAPTQYLGTDYDSGAPVNSNECVVGFDNIGFVMGTSSSLFNDALVETNSSSTPTGLFSNLLQDALQKILEEISKNNDDIADYPNPFYGYRTGENDNAGTKRLTLVDGGEDGQNIPLNPLIQPYRHVDVIFAVDSSADTDPSINLPTGDSAAAWPAGISLVDTYERSLAAIGNGTLFPAVPDVNTFINLGLAKNPTFFGCDASNLSSPAPLIVYLPNNPYVYNSNVSTFDLQYNATERNAIVLNSYNMATQGNNSLNYEWSTCVGCAIINRSLNRTGTAMPDACTKCFEHYCWNGTIDSRQPSTYIPQMRLPNDVVKVTTSGARERFALHWTAALAAPAVLIMAQLIAM